MGGEDSDTEGFMDYYDQKQKEANKTGSTTSGTEMLTASRQYEESASQEGGKRVTNDKMTSGIASEKSLFGSTFLGGLVAEKGLNTGSFVGTGSEYHTEQEGDQKEVSKSKMTELVGERTSGGLFGSDKYQIHETGGSNVITTDVTKSVYNDIQDLVKEGKVEEATKKLQEFKNFMQISQGMPSVTAMGDVGGAGDSIGSIEAQKPGMAQAEQISQTPPQPSQAPIVIKQGDTVNQITNNNTSGGGSGGAATGTPSRMPNPFDKMVFGEPWAAYP